MNKLNINVFCNLSGTGIVDILRTMPLPNGVTIKFCDMFDDAVGYCILLTESIDEAVAFKSAGSRAAKLFSVLVGDSKLAENRLDAIDDIWPLEENANVTKMRFRKLVSNIKDIHDAWFYKNLYTTLVDSLPELSWCKDLEGLHYNVNKCFTETVRKSKEECEGRDHYYIWDVRKEDNAPSNLTCVDSEELVLKEQRTLRFDENLATPDGMMKLITYKSPIFNEFGEVVGTVGVAQDVTTLANVQSEHDLLVESVPFPVIVVDANWKTKMINNTMRRLLNLKGPIDNFDYLTWKKYFLVPVSEPVVNAERHFVNQLFAANDDTVSFTFQINEQDIIDVFGDVTGHIIIPRKMGPNGEMLGTPAK